MPGLLKTRLNKDEKVLIQFYTLTIINKIKKTCFTTASCNKYITISS